MRGLILSLATYPWRFALWLVEGWNTFWHTPADPIVLGLIRVCTGLMVLYTHAVWGLALKDFLGPYGWVSPELAHSVSGGQYAYSFWNIVPDAWMWPVFALTMIVFTAFTVGFCTRISAILSFIAILSYVLRVPEALFGLDKLEVILVFYLAIGDSGKALSVDRLLRRRRQGPAWTPSAGANLGIRLIQVHMCMIYFFAGISKLRGPAWWTGNAMWLALANSEYRTIDVDWLAWHPWMLNSLCHLTIAWELSFCVLIWHRMWRPLVLLTSVFLHAGIGECLGLWTFSLIMLIGCMSFLPPEPIRVILAPIERMFLGSHEAADAGEPARASAHKDGAHKDGAHKGGAARRRS